MQYVFYKKAQKIKRIKKQNNRVAYLILRIKKKKLKKRFFYLNLSAQHCNNESYYSVIELKFTSKVFSIDLIYKAIN